LFITAGSRPPAQLPVGWRRPEQPLNLNSTTHTNVGDYTTDGWSFSRTLTTTAPAADHDQISRATLVIGPRD
jgi:hypothetical protein